MKEIKDLESQIQEELNDAEKYVNCALSKKESYPVLSALYLKLSIEEMVHAEALHSAVEKLLMRKAMGQSHRDLIHTYSVHIMYGIHISAGMNG